MSVFKQNILDMSEYKPPLEGRSRGYLLLDFNERTTPPHKRVRDAVIKYGREGAHQKYPEYGDTENVIANYAGVRNGQVILTNGSDQAIDIIFRGTVHPGDKVIIPSPSFAMFYQSAGIQGADIKRPRYRGEELSFPLEEVLDTIDRDTRLVVVCNPNSPTGTVIQPEDVEKVIKRAKEFNSATLVDEAYHEFNRSITVKRFIDAYDNLFITRTFSKALGMAALRAGYVLSQKDNILQLRKIRGPYDMNMEAVHAVNALVYPEVVADIQKYVSRVMNVSKPRVERFLREHGVGAFPSGANFVLIKPTFVAEEFYEFLKSKSILVRPRDDPENTLRITIGTRRDTDVFLAAFREYLETLAPI